MKRLLMSTALVGSLAIPAFAAETSINTQQSQQPITQSEARRMVDQNDQTWNQAFRNGDAVGLSSLYADDALRVTPTGLLRGRQAIEKDYTEGLREFSNVTVRADQVEVLPNGTILVTGSWEGNMKNPPQQSSSSSSSSQRTSSNQNQGSSSQSSQQVRGFWANSSIREGNTLKIKLDVYNMAQDNQSSPMGQSQQRDGISTNPSNR